MSSAKCFVCINYLSTSTSLIVCETVVRLSNSLDPDETPSVSSGSKLFVFGTMVAIGRIRVSNIKHFFICLVLKFGILKIFFNNNNNNNNERYNNNNNNNKYEGVG